MACPKDKKTKEKCGVLEHETDARSDMKMLSSSFLFSCGPNTKASLTQLNGLTSHNYIFAAG